MSSEETQIPNFRSGFVGIVGPTNAGKSTLLNALIGQKISIVSSKVQTTYHNVRGILNGPQYQLVFVDTPGLQNYRENFPRLLNKVASQGASNCDVLVWVFDCSNPGCIKQIEKLKPKIQELKDQAGSVCVLNKVDIVHKQRLLPLIEKIHAHGIFSDIIPVSAKKNNGVVRIVEVALAKVPEGPQYFASQTVTDRSTEFLLGEMIREKVYEATHQEIPYSVYIEMEPEAEAEEGVRRVPEYRGVIHVDSQSRKAILLGKSGLMLKRIGTNARKDMEKLLGKHICLKLHVDVETDWKSDTRRVNDVLELGH